MANDKENNDKVLGSPAASATSPAEQAEQADSTTHAKMQDDLDVSDYTADYDLDDIVTGGCSTCGSDQHDTVKCDKKDAPPEFMMSGALQADTDSSTSAPADASTTAAPAEKGDQGSSGMPASEGMGRRHSA